MSSFRDEIVSSLQSGDPLPALIAIVERHKANGMSRETALEILESIWSEHGCQEIGEEESVLCGLLGGLMDRVWGYCSSQDAIWKTPLQSPSNPPTSKI